MPFPRGPRFPTVAGAQPPPTSKHLPVLGVGWRVTVACRNRGADHVMLTDDTGASALATVAHGAEVEILAWRPRRGGDTRYRVVSTNGGVEGWLGAESLRARPLALPPKVARTAAGVAMVKSIKVAPKSTRRSTR